MRARIAGTGAFSVINRPVLLHQPRPPRPRLSTEFHNGKHMLTGMYVSDVEILPCSDGTAVDPWIFPYDRHQPPTRIGGQVSGEEGGFLSGNTCGPSIWQLSGNNYTARSGAACGTGDRRVSRRSLRFVSLLSSLPMHRLFVPRGDHCSIASRATRP